MDTLFDLNEADPEYKAFKTIQPFLLQIIEDNYAPQEDLIFQKNAGYSSIYYCKSLIIRIYIRKKSSYFSFSTNHPEQYLTMNLTQNKTDAAAGFYRCGIADPEDIAQYEKEICKILDKAINSQPKECDICDLYNKCSDAGKCVHPKRSFALHCGYRRILRSGRIFYGENRNVD